VRRNSGLRHRDQSLGDPGRQTSQFRPRRLAETELGMQILISGDISKAPRGALNWRAGRHYPPFERKKNSEGPNVWRTRECAIAGTARRGSPPTGIASLPPLQSVRTAKRKVRTIEPSLTSFPMLAAQLGPRLRPF
jgi:hypothetical protein